MNQKLFLLAAQHTGFDILSILISKMVAMADVFNYFKQHLLPNQESILAKFT